MDIRDGSGPPVDLRELRGAAYRRDVPAVLAAVDGHGLGEVLQHVGVAAQVVLSVDRSAGEQLASAVLPLLEARDLEGDDVLAEDLRAELDGAPPAGRRLPVDLIELASELSGDPREPAGFLDLQTGEVVPETLTDPAWAGEDAYVDLDEEPDRWLALDRTGARDGWQDMATFAARQPDVALRRLLELAIDGKGAFRRFRNVVHEEGLADAWHRFADDREIGRARAYLAAEGIRAVPDSSQPASASSP